jgi:SAM-dependent methyltransferase
MRNHSEVFTEIYDNERWGKGKGSGTGSDPSYCRKYLENLRVFLEKREIKTVLDLGCGDRQLYNGFSWQGYSYLGVDVVPSVAPDLVHDFQNDPESLWTQSWDLVILKDVLMHWTNEEVVEFMDRLVKLPFKYLLITNSWKYNRVPAKNALPRELDPRYSWAPLDVQKEPLSRYGIKPFFYFKFKQTGLLEKV